MNMPNSLRNGPDEQGRFGIHGGRFVAETLMPLILELEQAYEAAKRDPAFHAELEGWFKDYLGRPSPLYYAEGLTDQVGGAKISSTGRWGRRLPRSSHERSSRNP